MKIVIRRHASDYHVFRALAVAQAVQAAAPDSEVFIECFDRCAPVLKLCPSVKWKNPHHPYEVTEREMQDSKGVKSIRPGGKLYHEVIDIDAEGPLEMQLLKSGLPWWRYATARAATATPFGAGLKIPPFPTIEAVGNVEMPAADFIVIAPLSPLAFPGHLNVKHLEDYAKGLYPSAQVFWLSPEGEFLGENRPLLNFEGYPQLASLLASARAVFAVNGIVSALAQSKVAGVEGRLVKRYHHVRGQYAAAGRDIFLRYCAMSDTEIDRSDGEHPVSVVTTAAKTLEISELVRPKAD